MVIMIDFTSFNPCIVVIYRLESVFVVQLDHLKNNFQISHLFDSVSNYDVNSGGIVHNRRFPVLIVGRSGGAWIFFSGGPNNYNI
jgi:hypothetical protein